MSLALRDRLPSLGAAIALQAGLFALLALSFTVVRQLGEEKETILVLPPLSRPTAARAPAVIDARPRTAPGMAPPVVAAPPPAWASEGFVLGGGGQGGVMLGPRGFALDCRPQNTANLNASERKACASPAELARRDPGIVPLLPNSQAKNAPIWQAEIDRRNAPIGLPGASKSLIGLLATLLGNPGAYGDRRSYSYAEPPSETMDGAEMTRQFALHGSACPESMDDASRNVCKSNLAAAPAMSFGGGVLPGGGPHVSDAAFQQALAAAQARTRSIYGAPVPASPPP